MSLRLRKTLGGFHNRVVQRLTVRMPQQNLDRTCKYPPLEGAIAESGVQEVETYFTRRKNTVVKYIVTRPILDLCLSAAQRPGARVSKQWWEQEGLYLEGIREVYW